MAAGSLWEEKLDFMPSAVKIVSRISLLRRAETYKLGVAEEEEAAACARKPSMSSTRTSETAGMGLDAADHKHHAQRAERGTKAVDGRRHLGHSTAATGWMKKGAVCCW